MRRSRFAEKSAWRPGFAAAVLVGCLAVAPPAQAEDVCVPNGPHSAVEVMGITFSGTVLSIRQTAVDDVGVELWTITFRVDRVYARLPNHGLPPNATLSVGAALDMPSDNCGRDGDMGMRIGGRYLVSTGFMDGGTSIANTVTWELNGDAATLTRGLYKTTFFDQDFARVSSLTDALLLLDVDPSFALASPSPDSLSASPAPVERPAASTTNSTWTLAVLAGLFVAFAAIAFSVRRRGRKAGSREGQI
jgi:hypothetical protein